MGNQWAQRVSRIRFSLDWRSHESRFVAGGFQIFARNGEWQRNAGWDVGNLYFSSSRDASSGISTTGTGSLPRPATSRYIVPGPCGHTSRTQSTHGLGS
jgi:hypothetical protein